MPTKLKTAIIEFLANEFKLEPDTMGLDLNFYTDLNLTPAQTLDLLQRIQEALDFSLPEERVPQINTIEDLLLALGLDTDTDHST